MKYLKILLVFIPVTLVLEFTDHNPLLMFIAAALSIVPLAGILGEATEEISAYAGSRIGGFLNATFGNATELILALMALNAGLTDVVKASIAGSVIGNCLLVLGAAFFFGGLKYKEQHFNKKAINFTSSMLLLSVLAITLPELFTYNVSEKLMETSFRYEMMSILVALAMFGVYIAGLIFSFRTHKDVFGSEHPEAAEEVHTAKWSVKKAVAVLLAATAVIALESEFLVSAIEPVTKEFGLSQLFIGVILVPIIGNAAEHSTAIVMALKNKMDVAVEIALGSSLQIIMFVMPVLVFVSMLIHPMSMRFSMTETAAMIASVFIANKVAGDGESNWLEGLLLLVVYMIAGVSFFIV